MNKKFIIIMLLYASLLVGCTTTSSPPSSNTHYNYCATLKQKLAQLNLDHGPGNQSSPATKANLMRQYDSYQCANYGDKIIQ